MEKQLRPAFPPLREMALPGNGGSPAVCTSRLLSPDPTQKNSPLRESFFIQRMLKLFCDLSYNACAYGTAAFTDSETLAFFHSDRGDELNAHFYAVSYTHLTLPTITE